MPRALSPLGLTVLRLLSNGPMHPYEMQQQIRDKAIDQSVKVTHGALYHTVDRLAADGMIEPIETSRAGRRPERTVYAITEAGSDAAFDRLRHLLARVEPEFPIYRAALSFISLLSPEEAAARLGERCIMIEASLAAAQTAYDGLLKGGVPRDGLLEFEHAQAHLRADLDLTRSIVEDLRTGRFSWSDRKTT